MKYWRVGQRRDEPVDLPVHPGLKRMVTVQVLVDADDENEATDILGEIMRGEETFLTNGPILDWKFGQIETYQISEEYEEGEAWNTLKKSLKPHGKTGAPQGLHKEIREALKTPAAQILSEDTRWETVRLGTTCYDLHWVDTESCYVLCTHGTYQPVAVLDPELWKRLAGESV